MAIAKCKVRARGRRSVPGGVGLCQGGLACARGPWFVPGGGLSLQGGWSVPGGSVCARGG